MVKRFACALLLGLAGASPSYAQAEDIPFADGTIRIDTESTPLLYCLQPQLPGDEDPRR